MICKKSNFGGFGLFNCQKPSSFVVFAKFDWNDLICICVQIFFFLLEFVFSWINV
jgi:hypothetical protein